jgi:hypothetical protein
MIKKALFRFILPAFLGVLIGSVSYNLYTAKRHKDYYQVSVRYKDGHGDGFLHRGGLYLNSDGCMYDTDDLNYRRCDVVSFKIEPYEP